MWGVGELTCELDGFFSLVGTEYCVGYVLSRGLCAIFLLLFIRLVLC